MSVISDRKKITVVGTGLGLDTMTAEAREAIAKAEVLIGAAGVLEPYKDAGKPAYPCYLPQEVTALIESENAREFAVLVSGDVGFYSAAAGLAEALASYDVGFIPGISTVNAFFARLRLPWQDVAFVSVHGRDTNLVDAVRRNRLTFCLTGKNVNALGAALVKAGLGQSKAYIGENLGSPQERVYEAVADDLAVGHFSSQTVLLFANESFDDRTSAGLPDSDFVRQAGVPMTKSETRAVVMSKLNLRPSDICWDIGAGTGSVSVEMALNAYRGHVYAVERREDAIPLIEQNCTAFHLGNVTVICGDAPASLDALPAPNAVFIGGSGGEMDRIIDVVLSKNPNARIVVSAVTLETVPAAMAALAGAGLEPDVVQINAARGRKAGVLHLMEAQNPVTILSAGGRQ